MPCLRRSNRVLQPDAAIRSPLPHRSFDFSSLRHLARGCRLVCASFLRCRLVGPPRRCRGWPPLGACALTPHPCSVCQGSSTPLSQGAATPEGHRAINSGGQGRRHRARGLGATVVEPRGRRSPEGLTCLKACASLPPCYVAFLSTLFSYTVLHFCRDY